MNEPDPPFWKKVKQTQIGRRSLLHGVASTVAGASLLTPKAVLADEGEDSQNASCAIAKPIPGGVIPFKPFGVVVHHNPLNAANPLSKLSDPSQITDFDGFVGLTHIRGGGTGTNTGTG